ncbi:polysaccharide lyase family 3 protein [Trematosphaeria pertusa]|uniref:Pectate lyase n=1 Tax=Trematosphaeria pertusa TaxID=390896 RepID=A0A6A6IHG0_9PLEO|nr:polysaccharide lyase family 3 protein [Trematosphaeria pertusa]KAF2249607.1 polysaccharide lyase family 3 protein [Trematosphaeria pertusa]
MTYIPNAYLVSSPPVPMEPLNTLSVNDGELAEKERVKPPGLILYKSFDDGNGAIGLTGTACDGYVIGGDPEGADDKVIQHNGGGTSVFYVEYFGKLYRP